MLRLLRALRCKPLGPKRWMAGVSERLKGCFPSVPPRFKPLARDRHRCDTVWELLEDPHSSRGAWWISQTLKARIHQRLHFLEALVIGSVTVTILQVSEVSIPGYFRAETGEEPVLEGLTAVLVETGFDLIFLLEFLCRIFSAPSKKEYLKDPLNWADLASASGLPLRLSIGFILVKNQEPARQVVQVTQPSHQVLPSLRRSYCLSCR